MKYLFVAIVGLVLGAAAAGVVLYFNPLAAKSAPMPSATDRVLSYSLPDHVLEFAVGEDARLFGQDTGDDSLWEETIDRAAVLALVLNDGSNQPAALASRLLSTSAETDLLLRGVLVSDHWLVTVPGEGTLFVRGRLERLAVLEGNARCRCGISIGLGAAPPSTGRRSAPARTTAAASSASRASFRGSEGSAVERYEVTALDPGARGRAREGRAALESAGPASRGAVALLRCGTPASMVGR